MENACEKPLRKTEAIFQTPLLEEQENDEVFLENSSQLPSQNSFNDRAGPINVSASPSPGLPHKRPYTAHEGLERYLPLQMGGSQFSLQSSTTHSGLPPSQDKESSELTPTTPESVSEMIRLIETSRENSPRASMNEALKSEKAFIEYVMSLPSPHRESRTEPVSKIKPKPQPSTTQSTTKVGLDHLDNLCKLMEQLSELRETNTKLQKRVQYLEDLKTLHEMHKEIRQDVHYGSENALLHRRPLGIKKSMTSTDYTFSSPSGSQDILEDASTKLPKDQKQVIHRSRTTTNAAYDGRRRERSKSVGHEELFDNKSKRIFPKWSRVKEALGFERSGQAEAKHPIDYCTDKKDAHKVNVVGKGCDNSSTSGGVVTGAGNRGILMDNYIAALRIPLYSEYLEKDEGSPSDSVTGDTWTGRYSPVLHSSEEDVRGLVDGQAANWKRESMTSTKRLTLLEPPTEGLRRQKSTPSPSSDRLKTDQELLDLKPKSLTIERDIDAEQAFARFEKEDGKKSHKSPWGRVKTIIERRRDSLKQRHLRRANDPGHRSPPLQRNRTDVDPSSVELSQTLEDLDFDIHDPVNSHRKSSDDRIIESLPLTFGNYPQKDYPCVEDAEKMRKRKQPAYSAAELELLNHPELFQKYQCAKPYPCDMSAIQDGRYPSQASAASGGGSCMERDPMRTPSSSPQFHRKSRWNRVKKVLRGKKEEDGAGPSSQSVPSSPNGAHDGTFDFEETDVLEDDSRDSKLGYGRRTSKLGKEDSQELDCCQDCQEITRVESESYVHKLSLSASAPVADLMQELQRNLSEDFNRKIQEWERIRASGGRPTSPKWERKNSGPKSRKKQDKVKADRFEKSTKQKIKDLSWLEKELQKIEKEKQRLAKEKQKYEERAVRLERLRETVLTARNTNKKEVFVRTSAGEFRFEGISDAFTKKLYEWETKRGVGPELSTIALLDSSLGNGNKACLTIQQADKCGLLQRGISRSESSLADIGQPSHTSSNSLPSLKPPEVTDLERIHHHSRANSEPDLSALAALTNSGNSNNPHHKNVTFSNASPDELSRDSLGERSDDPRISYAPPEVTQLIDSDVEDGMPDKRRREVQESEQREENYYNLLEENVILLEQLKNKEEICRRLEKELELLDEKVDEMNSHHEQEMERYREKLWEMHKPGTTPRDVQGCLQIMSELRTRIEELEKCSERLRSDRETIEDSFRFHSEQQEHMTLDLLDKMRELQAAGGGRTPDPVHQEIREKKTNRRNALPIFDIKIIDRLQDLSGQLVKQTRELEQVLVERTQQICQLRWELLHRDVSTMKLETELHSAHIQGGPHPCRSKCDAKRSKYAHFRSWSSEEASNRSRQEMRSCELDRALHHSQETYRNLPKTEYQTSDLTCTVHELNKELLRLSCAAESLLMTDGGDAQEKAGSAETENSSKLGNKQEIVKSENQDPLCGTIKNDGGIVGKEISKMEGRAVGSSHITVRRNSADNISSVSGPDGSESSSLNEGDKASRIINLSRPSLKRSKSNASTSSEASLEEESFTSVSWCQPISKDVSDEMTKPSSQGLQSREMILKYPSFRNRSKNQDAMREQRPTKQRSERAVASDSKIPLSNHISIPKSESVGNGYQDKKKTDSCNSERLMNSKERREMFANRRDQTQRRKAKRTLSDRMQQKDDGQNIPSNSLKLETQHQIPLFKPKEQSNGKIEMEAKVSNGDALPKNAENGGANCKGTNLTSETETSSSSITVKLPRKRSKALEGSKLALGTHTDGAGKHRSGKESSETFSVVEETVTVVIPKRRSSAKQQNILATGTGDNCRKTNETCSILRRDSTERGTLRKKNSLERSKPQKRLNDKSNVLQKSATSSPTTGLSEREYKLSSQNVGQAAKFALKSPFISSRSPRKLKKDIPKTNNSAIAKESNLASGYIKSPSAPQLDWKKMCAKKISREGAPNVKVLIEKYNQKVLEHQAPPSPRLANLNSLIPTRKISEPQRKETRPKHIPRGFSSTPTSPQYSPAVAPAMFHNSRCSPAVNLATCDSSQCSPVVPSSVLHSSQCSPMASTVCDNSQCSTVAPAMHPSSQDSLTNSSTTFHNPKCSSLTTTEQFHSPPVSPPTSPASRARAEALLRAKEQFISSSSIFTYKPRPFPLEDSRRSSDVSECTPPLIPHSSKDAAKTNSLREEDRISTSSTRSMDSMSLVVYRTGESCQESRLSRRTEGDRQNTDTTLPECPLATSKSLSNSSLFKSVTGHESSQFKLPSTFLNLRLRKSRRKKDMATVSELCRQSLFVDEVEEAADTVMEDASKLSRSPRSCPSSPELKSKSKTKSSWLHRNIFRQK